MKSVELGNHIFTLKMGMRPNVGGQKKLPTLP
jgi:hypothetical protein